MIIVAIMALAPGCNSQERELEQQVERLNTEKAGLKKVETTVNQLAEVTTRLSNTVILITHLKRRRGAAEMLEKTVNTIPKTLLLKELRFSKTTLSFTPLSPTRAAVSTFLSNLEETRMFENVKSVPDVDAPAGGTAQKPGYAVTCDYRKFPSDADEKKSIGSLPEIRPVYADAADDGGGGAKIQALERTVKRLEDQIRTLKRRAPREHLLRETLRAKWATLEELKEILPERADQEADIRKIQTFASQAGLKVTACTAGEAKPRGLYVELPFAVEAGGRLEQVVEFLRSWDERQKLYWLSSMQLVFPTGKVHRDHIQVSLTLSTALQDIKP